MFDLFSAIIGGLHEDKLLYDTLLATTPTNAKTIPQIFLSHIESKLDRVGLLSPTVPTASVVSTKATKSRSK